MSTCRRALRSYHFVGRLYGVAYATASLPLREYLIAMLVFWLVTIRQVTLSCAGGAKVVTLKPSTSRISSPGLRPAFQAGPPGSTQPILVESESSLTGRPTTHTTAAKKTAS